MVNLALDGSFPGRQDFPGPGRPHSGTMAPGGRGWWRNRKWEVSCRNRGPNSSFLVDPLRTWHQDVRWQEVKLSFFSRIFFLRESCSFLSDQIVFKAFFYFLHNKLLRARIRYWELFWEATFNYSLRVVINKCVKHKISKTHWVLLILLQAAQLSILF